MYQGKRRHPQPERWRERQAAAAAAGVARRRAKYEQARALHANGATVAAIARTVGIGRRTVSRSLRQWPPQRKRHTVHGRPRVIAPDEPSLLQRWTDGCHTATVLWREIRAQGFAHSVEATLLAALRVRGWEVYVEDRRASGRPRQPRYRALGFRRRPLLTTDDRSPWSRDHRQGSGRTEAEALRQVLAAVLEQEDGGGSAGGSARSGSDVPFGAAARTRDRSRPACAVAPPGA
jgi:hypothetical protein